MSNAAIHNVVQWEPVKTGDYGIVKVIGGPLKGHTVYYDDENEGGRAICYLGCPYFSDYQGISFKFLGVATKEELKAFADEYMSDEAHEKAAAASKAERLACEDQLLRVFSERKPQGSDRPATTTKKTKPKENWRRRLPTSQPCAARGQRAASSNLTPALARC